MAEARNTRPPRFLVELTVEEHIREGIINLQTRTVEKARVVVSSEGDILEALRQSREHLSELIRHYQHLEDQRELEEMSRKGPGYVDLVISKGLPTGPVEGQEVTLDGVLFRYEGGQWRDRETTLGGGSTMSSTSES